MEFKSEEDFRGVAKRAVQILLYVVESKSPLLRKLRAKNFISNIYGANQNGTVYFEVEVPFTVTDPDHGPLCQELDKVLSAIINAFGDYHLNENMEFVTKTENSCSFFGFTVKYGSTGSSLAQNRGQTDLARAKNGGQNRGAYL